MHYSNTLAMLEAQRDKQTVYLENVLELMQAVFADVKYQTGKLVEDCQIENMDRLVANLSTVTGSILYIIRKREKEILSSESRYVATLEKVRTACDGYSEKINELDKTIGQLQKLQAQQEQLLAQEESKNAAMLELTRHTRQLQEQIDLLQAGNPETEAGKLQATIAQQEQLLQQLQDKFQRDCIEVRELECECQQLSHQVQEQENQLLSRTEAISAAREKANRLQQQLDMADGERLVAEEEANRLEQNLAQYTATYQQVQQRLDTLKQQVSQKEEAVNRCQGDAATHQEKLEQLQRLVEQTTGQAEDFTAQNTLLQTRLEQLQQQVALQREQATRNQLEREALETESAQLREKLMELDVALDLQKAANQQFQQEHLERVQQELAEARTCQETDRQQMQVFEQQLQQLREEYKTLNSELSLLKLTENSTRKMVAQEQEKLDAQKQVIGELEAQVREKASESTALMDREEELRQRLDEKNLAQIKAQIADNIAKLEQTLEQTRQDEESLAASSAQLEQALQNHNRISAELEKCRSQTAGCQQEYELLMTQYEKISTPEHQERMEQMENRLMILKKLAMQLSGGTPCGQPFRMDQTVAAELDRSERILQLLRQAIRQYAQCRQDALEQQ